MSGSALGMPTATARALQGFFEDWLGASAHSDQDVIRQVEAGLPLKFIDRLIQRGLSREEVFQVIINPRTLKHRRSRREPLSKEESERAVRMVRILARAQAVFGGQDEALRWLRSPKKRFEGRPPIAMLATETGGRMVEQMLVQIDEGMFA
jgi:putative toxin-antitoxin system antitoxin component (TIGR02293 family)